MADTANNLKHARGVLKIFEVCLAGACLIVFKQYHLTFGGTEQGAADRYLVGMITFGGMIIATTPLLFAYAKNPSSIVNYYTPILEILYNALGFILFLTVGSLVLEHYRGSSKPLTGNEAGTGLGVLCITEAVLYLIDACLAIKQQNE